MDIFNLLAMVGGLALFLYGMNAMGDGLAKLSGGKLEQILEKLTSGPIRAVLLGAAVTAVIQSSSATTVMVVGFVNSGIMKLSQAIGVIMGANIGTTITSWILSLSGIESDAVWLQLLKPSSFSPVLAIIGVVLLLFTKKEKKKDVGGILIGFAILMYGMEAMSEAVKPLENVPQFRNIMTMFSNPILGMIAGAALTAVIQSSSASVGILQALCKTGSVSYGVALPIIMGQNIGTCVTALISSVGANKNAKRAALVHLYFNLTGTIIFMLFFYSVNAFAHFAFLQDAANAAGIAVIHSVFNIVATLVLLPFSRVLERMAYLTIPDRKEEADIPERSNLQILDARFLDQPSFAIEQSRHAALSMVQLSREALFLAIEQIKKYNEEDMQSIIEMEDMVDHYEDELGSYLVKLSSRNLSEADSRTLSMLLHCIGDFERISDHAINIAQAAQEMAQKKVRFSEKAQQEMQVFAGAIQDIMNLTVKVFETEDPVLAQNVEPLEEVIDQLNAETKKRHIKRLRSGKCTIELGFILADITTNFERVADHCSNIAVSLIQKNDESFEAHEYLENLEKDENSQFRARFQEYSKKYILP